jgi:hypothetical protein
MKASIRCESGEIILCEICNNRNYYISNLWVKLILG